MKHYLIPQRLSIQGQFIESFEDYKLRRKLGNLYAKGTVAQRAQIRADIEYNSWRQKFSSNVTPAPLNGE